MVDILEEVFNWPTLIYNQLKEKLAIRAETSIQYIFLNFLYLYYKIKIFMHFIREYDKTQKVK